MRDFLFFRRMLTPLLIQCFFWIAIILCLTTGISDILQKGEILKGLEILIMGPIIIRILCEILILFFRMNETLTDLKNYTSRLTPAEFAISQEKDLEL